MSLAVGKGRDGISWRIEWPCEHPRGLFKVPYGGLSPRTVIPALAGIQQIVVFEMFWIPARRRRIFDFRRNDGLTLKKPWNILTVLANRIYILIQ